VLKGAVRAIVRRLHGGLIMLMYRTVRGWRDQLVDPQLTQLRRTVRAFESGPVDVLMFGDSSSAYVGADDVDQRRLPEMVADELGPERRLVQVSGPGYNPELFDQFIRILGTLPHRPRVVVLTLNLRTATATHVVCHPEYGHRRSIEILTGIRDANQRLRSVSLKNRRTAKQFEQFEALPVSTRWAYGRTIGEFLAQVRGRRGGPENAEQQRALFDYFCGETIGPDHPQVARAAALGETLRAYGVPVIQFWAPIPFDRGETYFPNEFREHVESNLQVVQGAFDAAVGSVKQGMAPFATADDEFIDSGDASEHWNQAGRQRAAVLLASEIRAVIAGTAKV